MIVLGLHRLALDLDLLAEGMLSERVRLLNTQYTLVHVHLITL